MHSKIWGKYGWYLLHSTAYLYDPKNKNKYMRLLNSYRVILPCPICRKHFSQKLDKIGDAMKEQNSYVKWLIDAHNSVNVLHGRANMSEDAVKKLYYKDDKLIIDKTQYIVFGQFILAEAIKRNNNNHKEFINFFSIVPQIIPLLDKQFAEDEIKTLSDCYKWGYYFTDATRDKFDMTIKNTMTVFSNMLNRIPTTYEIYEWVTKTILNNDWFEALKMQITSNPFYAVRTTILNGYNKYLKRDPDKGGFRFYFKRLITGKMNTDQFYNSLKNSPEGQRVSREAKKLSENKA